MNFSGVTSNSAKPIWKQEYTENKKLEFITRTLADNFHTIHKL